MGREDGGGGGNSRGGVGGVMAAECWCPDDTHT
jgi:hypothetical protein